MPKKIIEDIQYIVAEENFMTWKNEDVFEGIEKIPQVCPE